MSLRIDRLQLEIIIDNDQSRKQLRALESDMKDLKKQMRKVPEGSAEWTKMNNRLKSLQMQHDKVIQSIGLHGLSIKELSQRQKELNMMMRNMDPRSAAYKKLQAQATAVTARMTELRNAGRATQSTFSRLTDGFNKYSMIAASVGAVIFGLITGFRKLIDEANSFNKALSGLSSLTGLSGEKLEYLRDAAKEMSISQIEGGVRITKSAEDILLAYTKVGSKMPQLLENSKALNDVTAKALMLAEAGNIDLDTAVSSLTNTMNQFRAPASEAGRYINIIASGAKLGAADIAFLGESVTKFGAAANAMNVDVAKSVAMVEVLGKAGLNASTAGTGLKTFLLKSASAADEFNVTVVGLDKALDNLSKANLTASELQKMFGDRGYIVAQSLRANIDVYQDLNEELEKNAVANEMARINTDNNASKLEQAKNRAALLHIELGEKLAPALTFSTNSFSYLTKGIIWAIKNFDRVKDAAFILTTAIVAYNAQLIWSNIVQTKAAISRSILNAKIIASAIIQNTATVATQLYAAATMLLSGNLKGAAQAMRLVKAAMAGTPWGLIATLVATAGAAFLVFAKNINSVSEEQKIYNKIQADVIEGTKNQKAEVQNLIRVLQDEKATQAKRFEAYNKLNEISPDILDNMSFELAKVKDLTLAYDEYVASIEREIKTKLYTKQLSELVATEERLKEQIELQKELALLERTKDDATGNNPFKAVKWVFGEFESEGSKLEKLQSQYQAKDFIAEKGFDKQFGARPLTRAIQKYIEEQEGEPVVDDSRFQIAPP